MRKFAPLAILGLLAACAATSTGNNGNVKIETKADGHVIFAHAEAYRDNGQLVVKGILEYPPLTPPHRIYGQVAVLVVAADGEVVAHRVVEPTRPRIPRMSGRAARFVTMFRLNSARVATVCVTYHDGNHRAEG